MSFQFCWEYTACRRRCPVRDLRILHCWSFFEEEAVAGLRPCGQCRYRRAWADADYRAEKFPVHPPDAKGKMRRKIVLAVDDEVNILYALEETVSTRGYECVSAPDGATGLLIARGIRPDLILSDVIMPQMDGFELCHALKRDPATRQIPVVLVTVRTAERDRLTGGLAGADAYLFKPFSSADLIAVMDRLLAGG